MQLNCKHALLKYLTIISLLTMIHFVYSDNCHEYHVLRSSENWSHPNQCADKCIFHPIKHINLNNDNITWLSLGGHIRNRIEHWDNFSFKKNNDTTLNLFRLHIHSDLHIKNHIRLFIEGKTAFSSKRRLPGGIRKTDADHLALSQAFIDLIANPRNGVLTLRTGRQLYLFGKQRLVSPLPWANTFRTWDGITGIYSFNNWTITGFGAYFVPVRRRKFNKNKTNDVFSGLYSAYKNKNSQFDIYYLFKQSPRLSFTASKMKDARHTIGTRHSYKSQYAISYEIEGAYQFGKHGFRTINAYMFSTSVLYDSFFLDKAMQTFINFDYASGGSHTDSNLKTYHAIYPLGHAYLGYIDIVGRQNIIHLQSGLTVGLFKKSKLGLHYHFFWRASIADSLYNAGGAIIQDTSKISSNERYIGSEIDIYYKQNIQKHLNLLVGFNHFIPGKSVTTSITGARNITFSFIQLQYTI